MIEVSGKIAGGPELFGVEIENVQVHEDGTADYAVRFVVDRCGAVGMHTRVVYNFPRTRYNALALLRQALATLDPNELELEGDVGPSDLARRQRGAGYTLPRKASDSVSDHRPPFWRR